MKQSQGRFFLATVIVGALAAGLYACADDSSPVDEESDVDAATGGKDGGKDGRLPDDEDAANPSEDSGKTDSGKTDSGTDAGKTDSGLDAGKDAAPDASGPTYLDDAGTFTVVRVGTAGGAALNSASTAVFLENRALNNGTVTKTTALPVAAAGAQNAFTLRGTGTTEGSIAQSTDGNYLVLAGYSAAPGVATINDTTALATPRVVARIAKDSTIDTSTIIAGAFDTGASRSVASKDGTSFWVAGEGGTLGVTGGVWYVPLGNTAATPAVQVYGAAPTNLRTAYIFGDQLFSSTQSAGFRIFSIGAGVPVTAGEAGTELPGVPATGNSPNNFVMLDLDGAPGLDTMYVADTGGVSGTGTGGIAKWTFAAGTWTLKATFKTGFTGAPAFLTAKVIGTNVVLVAVTGDSLAKIVRFIDDGVNVNPTGVVLGTAATGAQYRGVALTPAL